MKKIYWLLTILFNNIIKKPYYWLLTPFFNVVVNDPLWDMSPNRGEVRYTVWKLHPIVGYFLRYDRLVRDTASSPMFSGCRTIAELNKNEDYVKVFGLTEENSTDSI
jgi:hypothetical protein